MAKLYDLRQVRVALGDYLISGYCVSRGPADQIDGSVRNQGNSRLGIDRLEGKFNGFFEPVNEKILPIRIYFSHWIPLFKYLHDLCE